MRGVRVLLTGGTGFVGSHLAEQMCARGADVRCLVRAAGGPARHALPEAAARIEGSLEDSAALARACEGAEVVMHLAGAVKERRPGDFVRVNVEGTRRLCEAAAATRGLRAFVHVSSLAACGPSAADRPRGEDDPPAPVSAYGRSKLEAEGCVRASGLPWVIARPPAVYGPRDRDLLAVFKCVARGFDLRVGPAARTVSLVHAGDLAAGLIASAGAAPRSTYFICDPSPYPWEEVVAAMASALGTRPRPLRVPRWVLLPAAMLSRLRGTITGRPSIFNRDKVREIAHAHWTCSGARAARELGFAPARTLREGIAQTAAWYREQGWL
ncbi:MAG TPA: hypothetical protein DCM87_09200 [Planctomycetes bacterium]|nr:hypothetical protein [Planctomycetota bacterium]